MPDVWTEERVERLKTLWIEGYTASQIAWMLGEGITRSGVCGKVHRLNLAGRPRPSSIGGPQQQRSPRQPRARTQRVNVQMVSSARTQAAVKRSGPSAGDRQFGGTASAAALPPPPPPIAGDIWKALPGSTPVAVVNHKEGQCRWPIGDPREAGFGYCGLPVAEKRPHTTNERRENYCSAHLFRATVGAPRQQTLEAAE